MFYRYNNETYRILDVAWDKDPTYQFTKRDGTQQTLSQYYREVKYCLNKFFSLFFEF
jgi:aubergine-like protein